MSSHSRYTYDLGPYRELDDPSAIGNAIAEVATSSQTPLPEFSGLEQDAYHDISEKLLKFAYGSLSGVREQADIRREYDRIAVEEFLAIKNRILQLPPDGDADAWATVVDTLRDELSYVAIVRNLFDFLQALDDCTADQRRLDLKHVVERINWAVKYRSKPVISASDKTTVQRKLLMFGISKGASSCGTPGKALAILAALYDSGIFGDWDPLKPGDSLPTPPPPPPEISYSEFENLVQRPLADVEWWRRIQQEILSDGYKLYAVAELALRAELKVGDPEPLARSTSEHNRYAFFNQLMPLRLIVVGGPMRDFDAPAGWRPDYRRSKVIEIADQDSNMYFDRESEKFWFLAVENAPNVPNIVPLELTEELSSLGVDMRDLFLGLNDWSGVLRRSETPDSTDYISPLLQLSGLYTRIT